MLRQNISHRWSTFLTVTTTISGMLVIIIGALLKVNPQQYQAWPTLQTTVVQLDDAAWWLIPSFAIIAGLSQAAKKKIGSINTWTTVHYLLEEYKDALFEKHATAREDPAHYHRVTLFKYVRWRWAFARWPWTGWMVPVARTGHTTHSWRIPRFRAPRSDPDSAEGVAGQTWVRNKTVPVFGLPAIEPATSDDQKETFCSRAFVSRRWLERRLRRKNPSAMPRSLLGIPVEVGGDPWGALVVDSRSESDISDKKARNTPRYKTLTEVLSKLLQPPTLHPK